MFCVRRLLRSPIPIWARGTPLRVALPSRTPRPRRPLANPPRLQVSPSGRDGEISTRLEEKEPRAAYTECTFDSGGRFFRVRAHSRVTRVEELSGKTAGVSLGNDTSPGNSWRGNICIPLSPRCQSDTEIARWISLQ